jgi:two-component system, OmpR family, response regulator
MEPRARILIVDDDRDIRTLLAEQLEGYGFTALLAEDGRAMRRALDREAVDLVVLDLNLPREDGLTLCRDLRARSALPVIMLTARGEPIDRILGLEMGADDYMPKPFEPRELVARIRNVLRRRQGFADTPDHATPVRRLRFAGRLLDLERRRLETEEGRVVMLSGAEFRFLKALAERPNQVFSREQLARIGAGREIDTVDRAVDLQISRLRAKLGDDARAPSLIKTIRSEGYVLAAPVERER